MWHNKNQCLKGSGAAIITALGLVAGFGATAKATIIAPGQTLPTVGTAPEPGSPIYDSGPVPFSGVDSSNNVVFTGLLDSKVYVGSAGLDFVYQFSDNANSPDPILHMASTSFSGFLTDADYVPGTGNSAPSTVGRDTANAGDTVDFNFGLAGAVLPGTISDILVVKTNSPSFALGSVSLQDGGNVSVSAPAPIAVPEPATVAITGFALCALGMRRRVVARN
jgi:hypothetical protein